LRIADSLIDVVRERGPITVAAFMELALYDPRFGYYARAPRRSGRAGDFFTSVDVGALFGKLLALQIAEMADILEQGSTGTSSGGVWDLVEAGAGNGRLSADVLSRLREIAPTVHERVRVHLVEASPSARDAQADVIGDAAGRLASSSEELPPSYEGVLFANELLDACPVHQVIMRGDALHEVYVDQRAGTLVTREGPLSTRALADYLTRLDIALEPGWRVEISLAAVAWVREAARRLRRGFMILIDYGHPARELYSVTHASGTLTSFSRHTMAGPDSGASCTPLWLAHPGEQDMTAHVDFTSIRAAAEEEGMATLGFLDQTYFLLGLVQTDTSDVKPEDRPALKTLVMPGGLGSTMKVLILGKGVGIPTLRGCSYGTRIT
jgi:SAM-dependent MidA family methyltransferase